MLDLTFLTYFINHMISLTIIGDEHYGDCDTNGQYNGMFGYIQRNEVDFTLSIVPLSSFDSTHSLPGIGGIFVSSWPIQIASKVRPGGLAMSRDMVDSIQTILPSTTVAYVTLFLFILGFIGLIDHKHTTRRRRRKRINAKRVRLLWDMITLLTRQPINFDIYCRFSQKLLLFNFGLALFCLFVYYNSYFSTDLAVTPPDRVINTLEDLLASNSKPAFDGTSAMYKRFRDATGDSILRRVWDKISTFEEYVYLTGREGLTSTGPAIIDSNLAMMAPSMPLKIIQSFLCVFDSKSAEDIYYSPTIDSIEWYLGSLYSYNIVNQLELRERIDFVYKTLLEFGHFWELEQTGGLRLIRHMGATRASYVQVFLWYAWWRWNACNRLL